VSVNDNPTPLEFLGANAPTIAVTTSTVIQTITMIQSFTTSTATTLKVFTNATACSVA
jgi:hypothetical protein